MKRVDEKLWRRENTIFTVDILVGRDWVRHDSGGHNTVLKAIEAAKEALRLPAVRAVRILELETVQTCTIVSSEEKNMATAQPIGMEATGRKAPCPRCKELVPVSSDGKMDWTVCAACKRTLPVG